MDKPHMRSSDGGTSFFVNFVLAAAAEFLSEPRTVKSLAIALSHFISHSRVQSSASVRENTWRWLSVDHNKKKHRREYLQEAWNNSLPVNIVQAILIRSANILSDEEKLKIVNLGRSASSSERMGMKSTYSKADRICGCEVTEALFCFTC